MGPYVSEIVNTFSPNDDVYFFFHDYEDDFFKKNVKKELHEKSIFYKEANSVYYKLRNLLFNNERYDSLIIKFCRDRNIELVHYINGIPSVSMQRKMEEIGLAVLSTVHDLEPHEARKSWYKMIKQNIIYKRLHKNLLEAKYLVTNSMEQYEKIKAGYPDKTLTFHSFPSLVTNEIINGKDVCSELRELSKPYILFFGRIEEYKGISLLYNAFMESPKLQEEYYLVIAGSGDIAFERKLNDNSVIFINRYIKDTEVAYLYKNAHCVVYPYISATQSGVLSLTFYFQTPVLASDVPFFKSIIESSKTGLLFKTANVEELKKQLYNIVELDSSEMRRKQKTYYYNNYDACSINTSLKKIYAMEWCERDLHLDHPWGVM